MPSMAEQSAVIFGVCMAATFAMIVVINVIDRIILYIKGETHEED